MRSSQISENSEVARRCEHARRSPQAFVEYQERRYSERRNDPGSEGLIRAFAPAPSCVGRSSEPLFGVTFTVKDCFAIRGEPLGFGLSPGLLPAASENAALISMLTSRGALLTGVTAMDAAALEYEGESDTARLVNPRNPMRAVGGSSCGAAISAAAGTDYAFGTDFAGSIRIPAALCELWGLKFDPQTLPRSGALLWSEKTDSIGVCATAGADLLFLIDSLAGSASELTACSIRPANFSADLLAEPSQAAAWRDTVASLRAFGADPEASVDFTTLFALRRDLAACEIAARCRELGIPPERLPSSGRALLAYAAALSSTRRRDIDSELAVRRERFIAEQLRAGGALLATPTLPCSLESCCRGTLSSKPALGVFLTAANLFGLPALSMPHPGLGALQLIGAPGTEAQLLHTALRIKQTTAPRKVPSTRK